MAAGGESPSENSRWFILEIGICYPAVEMVSDNPCSSEQLQVSGLGIHMAHFAIWLPFPVHKVAGPEAKLLDCCSGLNPQPFFFYCYCF